MRRELLIGANRIKLTSLTTAGYLDVEELPDRLICLLIHKRVNVIARSLIHAIFHGQCWIDACSVYGDELHESSYGAERDDAPETQMGVDSLICDLVHLEITFRPLWLGEPVHVYQRNVAQWMHLWESNFEYQSYLCDAISYNP